MPEVAPNRFGLYGVPPDSLIKVAVLCRPYIFPDRCGGHPNPTGLFMDNLNEMMPLSMPEAPAPAADGFEVFVPENVCPKAIRYAVKEGKLDHLEFAGGCDGNLKALSTLLVGMDIDTVIDKLSGITCGKKSTSCVDQLCSALRESA